MPSAEHGPPSSGSGGSPKLDVALHTRAIAAAKAAFETAVRSGQVEPGEAQLMAHCRFVAVPASVMPNSIIIGTLLWWVAKNASQKLEKQPQMRALGRAAAPIGLFCAALHFYNGIRTDSAYCDACYVASMASRSQVGEALRSAYRAVYPDSSVVIGAERVSTTQAGVASGNAPADFGARISALMPYVQPGVARQEHSVGPSPQQQQQRAAQQQQSVASPAAAQRAQELDQRQTRSQQLQQEQRQSDDGSSLFASDDSGVTFDDSSFDSEGDGNAAAPDYYTPSKVGSSIAAQLNPRSIARPANAAVEPSQPRGIGGQEYDASSASFEWVESDPLLNSDSYDSSSGSSSSGGNQIGARRSQSSASNNGGLATAPSWEVRRQRREALRQQQQQHHNNSEAQFDGQRYRQSGSYPSERDGLARRRAERDTINSRRATASSSSLTSTSSSSNSSGWGDNGAGGGEPLDIQYDAEPAY